jgi:hypothetical protein
MKFSIFLIYIFQICTLAIFFLVGYATLSYINPTLLTLPSSGFLPITINYWGYVAIAMVGFLFISLIGAFFDGVRNSFDSK